MSQYAFSDYDELQAAIADWLMRDDLTARTPSFIRLAEAFFDRNLRVKDMIQRRTATANARYITLPGDWRKAKNVQRGSDNMPLDLMSYEEIDQYRKDIADGLKTSNTGGPVAFALVGNTMELAPTPTVDDPAEIEMVYYANVPRLTDDSPTSWLLFAYPDLYLYAALVHSAPFLKDDERLALWGQLRDSALMEANESDREARFSGAPMKRRPANTFGV